MDPIEESILFQARGRPSGYCERSHSFHQVNYEQIKITRRDARTHRSPYDIG